MFDLGLFTINFRVYLYKNHLLFLGYFELYFSAYVEITKFVYFRVITCMHVSVYVDCMFGECIHLFIWVFVYVFGDFLIFW